MNYRVLAKEKDLRHMMQVIGMPEIPGTALQGIRALEEKVPEAPDQEAPGNDDTVYTQQLEGLLYSLAVIHNSTHRLLIRMERGFLYEYRNIYLFGSGIVIADKEYRSDCIRFTSVPYIPMAVGAVSCAGEADDSRSLQDPAAEPSASGRQPEKAMYVTEISPHGETQYTSACIPGQEPEAIDRMMRFLTSSHQECMKGVVNYA